MASPICSCWTATQAQALEPALECVGALLSPGTGIVDSHALMLALQGDLENAGGALAVSSALASARCSDQGIELLAIGWHALACPSRRQCRRA